MSQNTLKALIEPLTNLMRMVKQNNGIKGSLWSVFRTDELKDGTLVGEDKYGNKYYHNTRYFIGRSRWVVYADYYFMNYDAGQVPPEWHGWLHYSTDQTPVTNPPVQRKWMIDHKENTTGTKECYVPYNTSIPKIESWKPPN